MKEIFSLSVAPGEVLQVYSSGGTQSERITVPEGVSSVTVIIWNSEELLGTILEAQGNEPSESGPRRREMLADKPESLDAEKQIQVEAQRLATSQGLNWRDLSIEKRMELKKQVRRQGHASRRERGELQG
jgi:hypothetical protein